MPTYQIERVTQRPTEGNPVVRTTTVVAQQAENIPAALRAVYDSWNAAKVEGEVLVSLRLKVTMPVFPAPMP